jgi:hypothetical protein
MTKKNKRTKGGQTSNELDILMHDRLSRIGDVHRSRKKETMRTTIHVDDQLLIQAKAQAATWGVTLGQLIEDALRVSLMRRTNVEHCGRVRLITMQGTGTRPGIDLDNSHSILKVMGRTP